MTDSDPRLHYSTRILPLHRHYLLITPFLGNSIFGPLLKDFVSAEKTYAPERPRLVLGDREDLFILKCLEKNPTRRYATAQEFADELGRFLNDEPILARPVGPAGRLWRWCRRKPALATVGAVAAVLLGVVAVGSPIAAYRLNSARVLAQQRELKARRNAYAADMAAVQEALGRKNYGYALQLLRAHRPAPGETDLRGWEWRYFWDLCRSDETATLTRSGPAATTLRVSPSGRWLVSASSSGPIKLWNVPEAREALAFSSDGKRLASTGWDASVRVWDLPARREIARFRGSRSSYFRVGFSPDGTRLFVNEWDDAILFDIEAERQVARLKSFMPVFLDEDTVLGLSQNETSLLEKSVHPVVQTCRMERALVYCHCFMTNYCFLVAEGGVSFFSAVGLRKGWRDEFNIWRNRRSPEALLGAG